MCASCNKKKCEKINLQFLKHLLHQYAEKQTNKQKNTIYNSITEARNKFNKEIMVTHCLK